MKFFSAALLLVSLTSSVSAFSAVAPSSAGTATGNPDPVDRSMRGIDKDDSTFDPTSGDSPALTRNNNDQVWVPQVREITILIITTRDNICTFFLSCKFSPRFILNYV